MPRVKRGITRHRRHNKVLGIVKGHQSSRGHLFRTAHQEMMHSLMYAYRDRRARKRDMRGLWIVRINAAARENGLPYNRFMAGLNELGAGDRPQDAGRDGSKRPARLRHTGLPDPWRSPARHVRARYAAATTATPGQTTVTPPAPIPAPAEAAATTVIAPSAAPVEAAAPPATVAEQEAEPADAPLEHVDTTAPAEPAQDDSEPGKSR